MHGGQRGDHPAQLVGFPGMTRRSPGHHLEGQRHPDPVVVGVEQPGEAGRARQRRRDHDLAPVHPRGVGVELAADRLDEDGPAGPLQNAGGAGREAPGHISHDLGRLRRRSAPPRPGPPPAPGPTAGGRRPPGRSGWSRGGGPCGSQGFLDAGDQAARRLGAQLDGNPGARSPGRVGEVDVERVVERRVEGVVEVDVGRP